MQASEDRSGGAFLSTWNIYTKNPDGSMKDLVVSFDLYSKDVVKSFGWENGRNIPNQTTIKNANGDVMYLTLENENYKDFYSSVVSSFKFTNSSTTIGQAANWKTYKNDEYGFEIKYPSNWKAGISLLFPNVILFCPPELLSTDPDVICTLKQNVGHADTKAPIIFSLIQNKLQLTNEGEQYGSIFKEMQNSFKSFKQDSELKTYKNFGIEFQYPETLGVPQEIVLARATNILFDNNKLSVIITSQYNNETGKFDTFEQVVDRYTNGDNSKFIHTIKDFSAKDGLKGKAGPYRDKTASVETKAGFEAYFPINNESFVIFSADYNYLLEETFNQIISTLKLTK